MIKSDVLRAADGITYRVERNQWNKTVPLSEDGVSVHVENHKESIKNSKKLYLIEFSKDIESRSTHKHPSYFCNNHENKK